MYVSERAIARGSTSRMSVLTAERPPGMALRPSWFRRWFGRRKPTTYQRCLAVHIHFAGPHSALY